MIAVPDALWSYLTTNAARYVWAYELVLTDSTTLRYATEDVTWGGNAYTGLAVEQDALKESISFVVPEVTVYFGNAGNALRSYLEPEDKIAGARLTIRVLFRNTAGAILADSVVLFVGTVEPTEDVDEEMFALTAIGLLDGAGFEIPRRRLTTWCPWQFANEDAFDGNGHCPYASTTTANGAGAASTALTLTGNADKFANGDTIIIGAASNAAVAIASGGGTLSLTLAEARTWSNLDPVRHSACNREFSDCEKRQMTHRFGGFLGVSNVARAKHWLLRLRDERGNAIDQILGTNVIPDQVPVRPSQMADPTSVVPILYGRRRIPGVWMELLNKRIDTTKNRRVSFAALSEGVIDSIPRYYIDSILGTDRVEGGKKTFGLYWRDGDVGLDDTETEAEYDADPTTQKRNQNRDADTLTGSSYSETAYAKVVQPETLDSANTPDVQFEVKGLKVQKYTSAGATDGSPAWSENPVWQLVDLLLNDGYGLGLLSSDIDFAVAKPDADFCDAVVTSTEASTTVQTAQAIATTTCVVGSTEGFVPGRRVDVNSVANTVDRILSDTVLILGTAVTQSVGHTVVQKPPRFGSSLWMDSPSSASTWIQRLLLSCRGYVTYDSGKVQLRVERAHVGEEVTDGGLENWTSTTNATNWNEATGGGTVNRESTIVHGGTYSVRLDRTSVGPGLNVSQSLGTGFVPGALYRLRFWAYLGTSYGTDGPYVEVRNNTQGKSYNTSRVWTATGFPACVRGGGVIGAWTQFEVTIRIDPSFALTDSYTLTLDHTGSNSTSIYYDDVTIRGPYAADCRESGDVLNMGILDGSFRWAPEGKERETNRVVMRIVNEAGYLGPDEAVAQDFVHQRTHPVKTINLDGAAVVDRDQATRLCKWRLAKYRDLGRGGRFDAGPGALAVQPGDVILVSHSVPNWSVQEHRVVEKQVYGRGDSRELCVLLRTEPYDSAIYTDEGVKARRLPSRPTPNITLTLQRRSARQALLSWVRDASAYVVTRYQIHKSTSASFTPDASNLCGVTRSNRFVYQAEHDEILTTLYFQVVAVTDRGEIVSGEVSGTIVNDTADDLDPTAMESALPINMVYGSDFNDPAKWTTIGSGTTYPGTSIDPNADSDGGGAVAWTERSHARDSNSGTDADLTLAGNENGIAYYDFAAATKTGRPRVKAHRVSSSAAQLTASYTLDKSAGTVVWVTFATIFATSSTMYEGPTLDGVDMSKFRIRLSGATGPSGSLVAKCEETDFEEAATPTYYGEVSGGQAVIQGDGTTNYGGVERAFPMQTPGATTGEIFNTSRLGRAEIWLRKLNSGDTLDSNPVLFELYDSDLGTVWTMASIAAADITANTRAYELTWTPGSTPVSGTLKVRVRTKQSKPIAVKRCLVSAGDLIFKWIPSPEELAAGYLGDFSEGDVDGWPDGARVVGTYRISEVS